MPAGEDQETPRLKSRIDMLLPIRYSLCRNRTIDGVRQTGHDPDGIRAGRTDQLGSPAEASAQQDEPGGATGPAEVRTRAEYYAACTEGGRPERSGWDAVDAGNRPALDA